MSPLQTVIIEGREFEIADGGDFEVPRHPHRAVVFNALAQDRQSLAAALRSLPPFGGSTWRSAPWREC